MKSQSWRVKFKVKGHKPVYTYLETSEGELPTRNQLLDKVLDKMDKEIFNAGGSGVWPEDIEILQVTSDGIVLED